MKRTFALEFSQGHPIIHINGETFLIGAGSPESFSNSGSIVLCGQKYNAPYEEYVLDTLNEVMFPEIDGLIGGDTFRQFAAVEFDYPHAAITFHDTLPDVAGATEFDINVFCNCLILDLKIDSIMRKINLDTDATIPYLSSEILPDREPDGCMEEVTPTCTLQIPVYELETEIAGKSFILNYGEADQFMLDQIQCDGVIGKDIFELGTVIISYEQGKMYLKF